MSARPIQPLGSLLRDGLLPERKIPAETRKRLSPYTYQTVSPRLVDELETEGWSIDQQLKRTVRMRRPKAHDVAFEDRVWAAFAKLDFKYMNKDRLFRILHNSGSESSQVDVFAADDEAVLVIECKSSEEVKGYAFKSEIEAISSKRLGMMQAIKKEFPNQKIRFILATNNFHISPQTQERMKSAELVHLDEDSIDYYLDLAAHLGKAARFQLLGNLFEGQKIPNLETRVPAIRGKMGGHTYYSFSIEPARLLKSAYILHRNKANSNLMPTYQRLIKRARLKSVAAFVSDGGFFPNSIILSVEPGRRALQFDLSESAQGDARMGILHLPQTYRAAYVIDGQHRLYGYAGSERADTDLVPVVAFEGLPRAEQVRLFMQINENQQAVPKSLRNTLNADLLWDSDDLRESTRALKLRVAQHLGEHKSSPLYGRVILGENKRDALRCITIDSISNGLERGNFLGSFTKTTVKSPGTLYRGSNDSTFDPLAQFLTLALSYVKNELPTQFSLGSSEGGFVFMNNGIESLLRVLSDIVDHLVQTAGINPRAMEASQVFDDCIFFLDPLIQHLASLTLEESTDYRRSYGSGGSSRTWRRLQLAIRAERPGFSPEGLDEHLRNEAKEFNVESFAMIRDIEQHLQATIRRKLEDEFGGAMWFKRGVPRKVQQAAIVLMGNKNVDLEPEDEVEEWDCLHLIDYHVILTQNHDLWQRLFAKEFTRPGEETAGGSWKGRANWLVELNRIRNENDHTYSVKEQEYEFLVSLNDWLIKGQASNDL